MLLNERLKFALTGTNGAGKGSVGDILIARYGFVRYSFREYIEAQMPGHAEADRPAMRAFANRQRAMHGNDVIVRTLYQQAVAAGGNAILDSIRALDEARFVKAQSGIYLIAIDADPAERYRRAVIRGSGTDKVTFEEFLEQERLESESGDPGMQNIRACMELADYAMRNDGSHEQLEEEVGRMLEFVMGLSVRNL